ncbi:2-succinyl-6-hydroxy-2,4-cyclohexadiene-1-carboxylate synthase [Rossellomorea aquimaris]|uniref:2-succinyl-6-hydroxy-2, 4-cyclohexadiene-1-carboxylate synthase n=1 Tax=Rossellomorea aquimaris TaxID=189382 RepID=UPI001CD5F1F5|nr:2-succinyl-6-hydroxy-2,4-cyclohexadiene-1-carboxylate synthase [Rossellomorea aquimaris]MCA1056793.1 2-succinyl-6-hydroxy-2,4-cyclohexadiene-1-carboxylate synthase [Rossellomorea aquimaris]
MIVGVNEIDYFVEVKGEGFPLVFLHGFTGDSRTWDNITDQLKNHFQCISIDLIGHGRSASPTDVQRYSMDAVSRDIECLLRTLDIKEAVLIGYSMGGRLALHFANLYPGYVRLLILESASPGLKTKEEQDARRKSDHALADKILQEGIESFVDFWEGIPLFSTQKRLPLGVQEEIRHQRLMQSPVGLSNSLKGMGTGAQPSWWDELRDLSFPVVLMVGELDQKFVTIAEEMGKSIPKGEIIPFFDKGHAIHVEDPRKFGTIIEDVLFNYIKEDV